MRWLFIVVAFLMSLATNAVIADEQTEVEAKTATSRFFQVLLKNPRPGTAFDKVYSFHIDRGSIAAFRESLRVAAKLTDSIAPEAGTITADMVAIDVPANADPAACCVVFGLIDLKHSESDSALVALQQAIALRPKDPIAHWMLARAFIAAQKPDFAIAALEAAIANRPAKMDLLEIYKELARNLQRAQRTDDALNAWKRLEAAFPGDLRVKEQIANTLSADGRWDEALTRYLALAAESKDPDQKVTANLAASDVMIQLGRGQEAVTLLESQLEDLDPDGWKFKDIRRRIESIFRDRDDLAGLASYYDAWVKAHPEDVDAMARLARTLSLQNKTAEASNWYRKAIALAPSNVSLRESLIEQLVRDNQLTDAIAQYDEMSKFDGGYQDHIERWGLLIFNQKDVSLADRQANAAEVWERLLTNRPDDPVTMTRLAGLLRRAELTDRAIAMYRSAIEKAPNDPQYREYLGEYLHQLQRVDEAVAEWKLMADGDRRNKANLIRLAEVLNRFNQTELSVTAMRDACSMDPTPLERVQFAEMLRNRSGIRENSLEQNVGRTERSEFRQPAVDAPDAGTRDARSGLQEELNEALQQLNLAEQSAETPDERQQILKERIQCLVAAGQLEQQIEQLSKELAAGTNVTAERWRTLALYQDAAENTNEATAAAIKVVELQPESIPGWTLLANLYERTGRLGDAADAMKNLASLDRRGISEYLRKTARLQVRLGQFDAALATGRDVIKATPGNPEAYQFFADLAFEVGQPKIAVDSLRQAVRVNPGDEASLKALAKTLADEFQTPEAIELYWRAFEKAPDLESQTQIVVALSNLYLRSNQFPKLIERLELRSRELNLPTEMTRCIATAYREAGDFRKADELVAAIQLSESALDSIEQFPLAVDSSSSSTLDLNNSTSEVLPVQQSEREQLRWNIISLAAKNAKDEAIKVCRQELASKPSDLELLTALAVLCSEQHLWEEGSQAARRMLAVRVAPKNVTPLWNLPYGAAGIQSSGTASSLRRRPSLHWQSTFAGLRLSCAEVLLLKNPAPNPSDYELVFNSGEDAVAIALADLAGMHYSRVSTFWSAFDQMTIRQEMPGRFILTCCGWESRVRQETLDKVTLADAQEKLVTWVPEALQSNPEVFLENRLVERIWWIMESSEVGLSRLCDALVRDLDMPGPISKYSATTLFALHFQHKELFRKSIDMAVKRHGEHSTEGVRNVIGEWHAFMGPHGDRQFPDGEAILAQLEYFDQHATLIDNASISPSGDMADSFLEATDAKIVRRCADSIIDSGDVSLLEDWLTQSANPKDPISRARLAAVRATVFDQLRRLEEALYNLILVSEVLPENAQLRFHIANLTRKVELRNDARELLKTINSVDVGSRIQIEWKELEWAVEDGDTANAKIAALRLFGLPISQDEQLRLLPILDRLKLADEMAALQSRLGRGAETRHSVLARKLQLYQAQGNEQLAGEVAWELLKLASGGTLFSGTRPNDDRDDGGERLQAIKALGKLKRLQPLIDRYEAMLEASPESLDLLEILCEFHEAAEQFPQLAEKRDRIALLSKKAPPSLKAKAVALENSGDVSGACDIYLQILKDDPAAFAEEMETYVQAFERSKRHADFLTAVLSLDEDLWSGNAALLINVTAELARAKSHDDVVKKSVEAMLANEETRRLAIGGFLARPDVIAEDQLLPAIQEELSSDSAFESYTSTNEIFLILQGIRQEASLKSLRDTIMSWRAGRRQPPGTVQDDAAVNGEPEVPEGSHPPLAEAKEELLLVFLNARLGDRAEVEKQLTAMSVDVANGAPSSGLSATFSPAGEKEQDDGGRSASVGDSTRQRRQDSSPAGEKGQNVGAPSHPSRSGIEPTTCRLMLFAMNARLKDMGSEWVNSRRIVLEWMLNQPMVQDDFDSLADSLTASDDAVMEELGAVYELLGDSAKSRAIMNRRIQALIANTNVSGEGSSESIRQLLQAGEKIQASGFPIEGTQLLLNVTQHDIDQFTKDLDSDKGIAFKSRFNASLRWAKQQITADKIVSWLGMTVGDMTSDAGRTTNDQEPMTNDSQQAKFVDLLLELNGTTDPRSRDQEQLKQLRIQSAILSAIEKLDFSSDELSKKIHETTAQLLTLDRPSIGLVTVAAAIAGKRQKAEQFDALCTSISRRLDESGEQQGVSPPSPPQQASRNSRIPLSLRSDDALNGVFLAASIGSQPGQKDLAVRLLRAAQAAANRSPNSLVRIAVLNECLAVAKRLQLQELPESLQGDVQKAIDTQSQANGLGIDGEIDLAHEIRTRLLKKGEPGTSVP